MKRLVLILAIFLATPCFAAVPSEVALSAMSAGNFYDWLMQDNNFQKYKSFSEAFEAFERSTRSGEWVAFAGLMEIDPKKAREMLYNHYSVEGEPMEAELRREADAMMDWMLEGEKWKRFRDFQEAFDAWSNYQDTQVWNDFVKAAGKDKNAARKIVDDYYKQ